MNKVWAFMHSLNGLALLLGLFAVATRLFMLVKSEKAKNIINTLTQSPRNTRILMFILLLFSIYVLSGVYNDLRLMEIIFSFLGQLWLFCALGFLLRPDLFARYTNSLLGINRERMRFWAIIGIIAGLVLIYLAFKYPPPELPE